MPPCFPRRGFARALPPSLSAPAPAALRRRESGLRLSGAGGVPAAGVAEGAAWPAAGGPPSRHQVSSAAWTFAVAEAELLREVRGHVIGLPPCAGRLFCIAASSLAVRDTERRGQRAEVHAAARRRLPVCCWCAVAVGGGGRVGAAARDGAARERGRAGEDGDPPEASLLMVSSWSSGCETSIGSLRERRLGRGWEFAGTTRWLPSSSTTTPPCGEPVGGAAPGPLSTAALARHSASTAVGASAVAWTTPVNAGAPVAGSSRWCAGRPSRRRASCAGRSRSWRPRTRRARTRAAPGRRTGRRPRACAAGRRSAGRRRSRRRSCDAPTAARRAGRRTGPWPARRCRSRRRAGGATSQPSTETSRQRGAGFGPAGRRGGASRSASAQRQRRGEVAAVAGGLDLAEQRAVDEPAGRRRGLAHGRAAAAPSSCSRARPRAGRRSAARARCRRGSG